MTTDDGSWALPEVREGSAEAAAIPGAPWAGAPTTPYGAFDVAGVGAGLRSPERTGPGVLLWIASALLAASALARFALLFTHVSQHPAEYDLPATAATEGYVALVSLACAALLLMPRTRAVAKGVVSAIALLLLSRDFADLRPTYLNAPSGRMTYRLLAAAFVLGAVAGVFVFAAILREGRRFRDRQSKADRVTAVMAGISGATVWFIAEVLAWTQINETVGLDTRTYQCCSWNQVGSWSKGYMAASGAAVLVLMLLAATGRSRARSIGLVIGTVLILADEVVNTVVFLAAPMASTFGIGRGDPTHSLSFTATALAGFWFGVVALVVLAATGALRVALAPRRAPFPEFPQGPPVG